MKRYLSFLAILLTCLAISAPLHAQVAGRISGSVVDQTGAAIPGAKVSLFLPGGSSAILATETTAEGLFNIPTVRPDLYDMAVDAQGFTRKTIARVKVDPSKETAVGAISLDLAATSTTVEVTASTAAVQTSTVEVSSTVTQSQVENLPVLDRQVASLFITQAGVSNSRTVSSLNGLRPSYSNILLDGVNVQDIVRTNALDLIPNRLTIGQIAEITVASSNLNPTIGGNATTVSLSTPSGTNQFHGNAYWYNRNSYFSANDWFNNLDGVKKPFLNLNQLGASLGGPIVRDKLLFFVNYEAYRLREQSPTTNTILTPNARQGVLTLLNGSTFNVLTARGVSIDPVVANLLADVPSVGNAMQVGDRLNTTGYQFNAQANNTRDNVTGKLDYYLSPVHVFSGSFIWNRDIVDRPDYTGFYTTVPTIYNENSGKFASASWRWSPGATITNELRGGMNKVPATWISRTGNPDLVTTGTMFTSPVNAKLPESRTVDTYSFQDNANWVKGKHTLSFGFQANLFRNGSTNFTSTVPTWTIGLSAASTLGFKPGDIPGATATDISRANALLATLAGRVSAGTQLFNVTSQTSGFVPFAPRVLDLRFNNYAPYITDTWKVARNLSLTLGLRWEYFSPVDEKESLLVQPELVNNDPVRTLLGNSTLNFGGASAGRRLYKRDMNNLAPNAGFAWDVFGNGRTAIRGGYGLAYANDNTVNTVYNALAMNAGLATTVSMGNLDTALSGGLPSINTPPFKFPTTFQDQYDLNPGNPPVFGMIDPNLKTPYVQQWNFGIQHDIKGFVVEGRYVGNHVVGMLRQIDYNQININQGGYLQDFRNARNNGLLAYNSTGKFDPRYNAAIPGSQALPFFNTLYAGGSLTNATVNAYIQNNEAATLAQVYQTAGYLPDGFSFFPNSLALYSSLLTNLSHSTYNAAQFEVRKRMHNGMQFQANYVFSKALSDAEATRGLEALLDNGNRAIEKSRSPFDLTHAFKVNHYIPLPFGPGHRFGGQRGFWGKVSEGWGVSGFLLIQSGPPVSILTSRGTLNRGARSTSNTAVTTLTMDQLNDITGLYMTPEGPYFIDPKYIGSDGHGAAPDIQAPFANQVFFNPAAGTLGTLQRRSLSGPGYWDYDFAVLKSTRITERQSIEFKADFYNVFNHPSFYVGDQNINSASFGRITGMMSSGNGVSSRLMQFGLFYRF